MKQEELLQEVINKLDEVYNNSTLGDIPEIKKLVTKLATPTVRIPLSEQDLNDLQRNESFRWEFNSVDLHLFKANGTCEHCDNEMEREEGLCNDCIPL